MLPDGNFNAHEGMKNFRNDKKKKQVNIKDGFPIDIFKTHVTT